MFNKRLQFAGFFAGLTVNHESAAISFRVANRPWSILFLLVRQLLRSFRLVSSDRGAIAQPSTQKLPEAITAVQWYHTIDLGNGMVTPGVFDHRPILQSYRLPERLDGLRVLDIATWDGFWAFEFERRGAKEVVALDIATHGDVDLTDRVRRHINDTHGPEFLRQPTGKGFQIAHDHLGSSVVRRVLNVYDVCPETLGTFDVVHVGDVLLHLKNPQRALENVFRVTSGYAIISEPYVPELDTLGKDRMLRYLSGEKDTIWWEFSLPVLRQMILDAGFERIEVLNTFHFGGLFNHAVIQAFPKGSDV